MTLEQIIADLKAAHPTIRVGSDENYVELGSVEYEATIQAWAQAQYSYEAEAPVRIQTAIVNAVQARLDAFAQTRNYDGILSAATYASSTVPKFAAEGQCAVNGRDSTWATLYTLMAEVEAGTRPMPTSYADIEPLLPVLVWPA